MNKNWIIAISIFFSLAFSGTEPVLDKEEAKQAYIYLNQIRAAPQRFTKEYPFLTDHKRMSSLTWNDTLARVAERKALDMATRNYFAHVDPEGFGINYYINKEGYKLDTNWLRNPRANFFESCNEGGLSGREAISMLLIDNGVPTLGHRKHLLGIDSWSATLYDVGIGFARAGEGNLYKAYTCVLIAKHPK